MNMLKRDLGTGDLCDNIGLRVRPEAVYCCFTRITFFTKLFTCLHDQS